MFPFLIGAALTAITITPGGVPIVAEPHPDETAYVQELKDARPTPEPIVLAAAYVKPPPLYPMPDFGTDYYPQETVDAILAAHFPEPVGLDWAYRVGQCESGFRLTALGAVGEISWFQHRPEFWANRSTLALGFIADPWNPEANVAVAAFMYYSPGYGPGHWTCK